MRDSKYQDGETRKRKTEEIFGKIESEEQRILSAERKRKEKKAAGRDKKQQEKVSRTFSIKAFSGMHSHGKRLSLEFKYFTYFRNKILHLLIPHLQQCQGHWQKQEDLYPVFTT